MVDNRYLSRGSPPVSGLIASGDESEKLRNFLDEQIKRRGLTGWSDDELSGS